MPTNDDQLRIVINGRSYQGWMEADCDSDVFSAADAWSCSGSIPEATIRDAFREGEKCDIYIGEDRQMAGFIDDVDLDGDHDKDRLRLAGRDKGGYLVDCESPALKANGLTVKKLFEKLLDPSFQIKKILTSNDANRKILVGKAEKKAMRAAAKAIELGDVPRASTKIDPGRKISEIISEHTSRLGITWWITADGNLFIGKPNYKQEVAYGFKVGESRVLRWQVTRKLGERASELQVNGSGLPNKTDWSDTAKAAPKFKAVAKDPDLVKRGIVRKQILRDTDIVKGKEATDRANLEQSRRQLDALTIKLTVSGFRDPDSRRIYSIDTLANVKIPIAGIDGTYWICQRRLKENRESQTCELTLKERGVWLA